MKNTVLISCLVVMVLASAVTACIRTNDSCDVQKPQECCSRYCRNGRCINHGDSPDDGCKNPCLKLACSRGECCALRQVQCIRAPCPPIAECVKC